MDETSVGADNDSAVRHTTANGDAESVSTDETMKKTTTVPMEDTAAGADKSIAVQHTTAIDDVESLSTNESISITATDAPTAEARKHSGPVKRFRLAELYPDTPDREAQFITEKFKDMLRQCAVEELDQERGDVSKQNEHFQVHLQLLWHEIIQQSDPVARMKGVCKLILMICTGLFKPNFVAGPKLTSISHGEHEIQRRSCPGDDDEDKMMYYQERFAYEQQMQPVEQFASGKVHGSMSVVLHPRAVQEGPYTSIKFGGECQVRIETEPRALPQSQETFEGSYGDLSPISPEDGGDAEVYTFNLPQLRFSHMIQAIAMGELVGICNIRCQHTQLEAELRFMPQLTPGIRSRSFVDGNIRKMLKTEPPIVSVNNGMPPSLLPSADTIIDSSIAQNGSVSVSTPSTSSGRNSSFKLKVPSFLRSTEYLEKKQRKKWEMQEQRRLAAEEEEQRKIPPTLANIMGHWDRKILVQDSASGEVSMLHNDPLIMRVDDQPVLDSPLNDAIKCPASMIMRRLWVAITDALDHQKWAEPLESVLKNQLLQPRHPHVVEKRNVAGVPLGYMLTYFIADQPTKNTKLRIAKQKKAPPKQETDDIDPPPHHQQQHGNENAANANVDCASAADTTNVDKMVSVLTKDRGPSEERADDSFVMVDEVKDSDAQDG